MFTRDLRVFPSLAYRSPRWYVVINMCDKMPKSYRFSAIVLVFASIVPNCLGQGEPYPGKSPPRPGVPSITRPGDKNAEQLVRMSMTADVAKIIPGNPFLLAFVFDVEPLWHVYWENAGSSGAPTEISIKAPAGYIVGRTLFPRPQTIITSDGPCYGYENQTVLFVEITPPSNAVLQASFTADVSWLVCKDICKMGSDKATLVLPVGDAALPGGKSLEIDPAIERFKSRLPKVADPATNVTTAFDGTSLTITMPAGSATTAEFFPNPSPGVVFGEAVTELKGQRLHTIVPVTLEPNNAMGKAMHLAGVIGAGQSLDDPCFAFDVPLTAEGKPVRN